MTVGPNNINEGGLLGGDPRLCGAVMDFLSELSGRVSVSSGGCFVAAMQQRETSVIDSSKATIKICTQTSAAVEELMNAER